MVKSICLILTVIITVSFAQAQNYSISGKINGTNNEPLTGASVVLLKTADSTFIKGSITDTVGFFEIDKLGPGKFTLKISFLGYRDIFLNKEIIYQSIMLEKILLSEKATNLSQAEVTGQVLPFQMKGDTTQYNADAFKTNRDATSEELITKMPGVTVQDGKVQAQGEDIKKITVDGRPFFGDDPNAVLKNLPAEVIDKIQVFDKKSDQSQFTGFDDGNNTKTINIVTKPQFRNGTFGKFYGGYGTDDKWKGGFNLNFFKDKRRISILANSNNINEQNFTAEDLLGVIGTSTTGNRGQGQRGSFGGQGGSGGRGGRQGGQDNGTGNFLVDQRNGINTTQSFGINYADKWGNLDFTGSYFFNYTENNTKSDLLRTFITAQNAGFIYNEESNASSKNINHRANLKFEWKIDSLNSILFQPKFSAQLNDGSSLLFGQNKVQDSTISSTQNKYSSNLIGINFSAPVLYRHSFLKKGRTISLNLTPGYNQNTGNSYLNSFSYYYDDTLSTDTLNQLANLNTEGTVLSSNVTYTEPLNDKSQLLFTYSGNYNKSNSDKETYNYSQSEENYSQLDTLLSNKFANEYFSNSLGTGYQYQKTNWSLTAGITFQTARQYSNQEFPYTASLNRTFNSWLPNALFMYRFSMQKNLRINYRSNNTAPSVTQLQNVINNSNPLQLTTGNPNLKQDWQNNFIMRYSAVNTAKSTSFFTFAGLTYTTDYIANSVLYAIADTLIAPEVILASGSQITQPVNLNAFISARSFNSYSFPITKIKCNLSLNLGVNYSRTPGLINNNNNYANSSAANTGFALSSNISEKWDFTLSSSVSYNAIANTLQKELNSSFVNYNSRFKIQVMPHKSWVLQTDITHQFFNGLTAGYDQNYFLWNAGLGYKFIKNNMAELRLTVFDILQQNQSVTRNTTDTYYEDVQTNVLERYFMLTFTYNLKFFKETKPRS